MTSSAAGPIRSIARVIGVALLVTAPLLGWATARSTTEAIADFQRLSTHRTSGDSAAYANAAYHAAHAMAIRAQRWHLNGFATLAVLGCTLGAAALAYGSRRHTG